MGIFKKTASGEGALDIYYQALEHEPDPRRRQKLYYQAIEVAAGTGAWYVISDALEHLLLDGEMSRDIPKILKLAEYLKPDARRAFSSAVAELREYGLSLEMVAGAFGLSGKQIGRLIARESGMSYKELLIDLRIARAKELLLAGESVSSVCEHLHYASAPYFIKLFREKTGFTPAKYQKTHSCGE